MGRTGASASTSARPALRLVGAAQEQRFDWAWFCGHCAATPAGGQAPAPSARVCTACGLGLFLETPRALAPTPSDAFLVVDSRMAVQAMSVEAELLLGTDETLAIDRPVAELLVPPDLEESASLGFAEALHAALSGAPATSAFVRPWNTYGIRMRATIAPCGPPQAALLVLPGGASGMRLVDR